MILSKACLFRGAHVAAAILSLCAIAGAQVSDKVSAVSAGSYTPGAPLSIRAELSNTALIERVELAYRQFGQHDYRRSEMALTGNSAVASVPAEELAPPFIEYYIILYLRGAGATETYPVENAQEHPLRADLSGAEMPGNGLITVLSPDPGDRLPAGDVLISFVLSQDSSIDAHGTKVYLDGLDVSASAVVSDRLYVIKPENLSIPLSGGSHTVRIELYDREGKPLSRSGWSFGVAGGNENLGEVSPSAWLYNYGVQLETRNENILNETTPYNRATLTASGTYGQYRVKGNLYATNEETDRRQPQNRYFIGAESPWVRIGYGDSYPLFPDLIMSGKRVRGLDASLRLGFFNLDVSKGDVVRRIESDTLRTFPADSLAAEQGRDSTAHFALYDPAANPQRWAELTPGTFNRDITVIRPSFGKEDAHIGFSYLKSTDDIGSIRYGSRPEENVVLGSDLLLGFDRRNIEVTGQAAISATNRDITRGTFSDADIDSIFKDPTYSEDYRSDIRKTRDIVSRFITVNENLVPLSLKNLSTLAYEGAVGLNYFNNTFRLGYVRHGESFESFGQPFLRTDVKGYNVSDRIRLMQNRLFLSGGFEHLNDNTANTKASTTTGATANVGVSYFPRSEFPNVTLAYLHASNVNDRPLTDTLFAVDDRTDRILVQLAKEFTFGVRQSATLSVSTSTRDDNTVKNLDTRNTTVSLSNSSTFDIPLVTTAGLTVNSSTFVTGVAGTPLETTLSYTTLSGAAQYRLMEDRLRLSGSLSPTFGDIQRVLVNGAAQYYFMKNLSLQTQLFLYFNNKLFGNPAPTNDTIWSLLLRLDV